MTLLSLYIGAAILLAFFIGLLAGIASGMNARKKIEAVKRNHYLIGPSWNGLRSLSHTFCIEGEARTRLTTLQAHHNLLWLQKTSRRGVCPTVELWSHVACGMPKRAK